MASVQTTAYDGRYLKLTVYEESTSIKDNTSTIKWILESIGGKSNYYSIYNWGVWVNGKEIYSQQTTNWNSHNFPASTGSNTGTLIVKHNSDGSAQDVSFTLKGCVYYNRDNTYNGSCPLSNIARQANIKSAPDFNDEENPTITYDNPAGTSVTSLQACISLTGERDDITYRDINKVGTSYVFNLSESERNVLRNACITSNSREVLFFVKTTIGENTFYSSISKKMTIINCNPTFNESDITYKDTDLTIVSITGNNQHIVRNRSNLKVTYKDAVAKKGASISKYEITFNYSTKEETSGTTIDYKTINLSSDTDLSIKVTDTRGNTITRTKKIKILDWILPTAIITSKRKNNYEDETTIKAQCTISSVNNINSIVELKFRYKKTTSNNWSSYINLSDDTIYTLNIDKNDAWEFQLVIKDKFGMTTYNFKVPKGVAILFIDTLNQSVGINCFPTKPNSFFVNGYDFNSLHPINSIMITANNSNPSSDITGTWELLTSTTINNNTIFYWKRIS